MSTKTKSRPSTEAERAERRASEREQMREAVEALRTSEGWQRWLQVRRHFHTYSLHNQLMIAVQCPEATRVAGFRKWLELGYSVRKGEKAIRIWAPCLPSKKQVQCWRKEGSKPDEEPRTWFRLVPVFDASQVAPLPEFPGEPMPLEPPHEPIGGDGLADRLPALVEFADSLELEVAIEKIPGAAAGFHEPATGRSWSKRSARFSRPMPRSRCWSMSSHMLWSGSIDATTIRSSTTPPRRLWSSRSPTRCARASGSTALVARCPTWPVGPRASKAIRSRPTPR
jgi:N-terminal domain of anti-restriction factor ArdC